MLHRGLGKNTHNRVQASQSSTDSQTTETSLCDGGINHPLRAKSIQQTSCHLVPAGKRAALVVSHFDEDEAFFSLHGKEKVRIGKPYAPLYCATSSPRIKVFGLLSNSSARASFKASRTLTSLTPPSDAYPRARTNDGAQDLPKAERRGVEARREESSRVAGRKSRGAAMAGDWAEIEGRREIKKQLNGPRG